MLVLVVIIVMLTFFNIGTWLIGGREKKRGLELIVKPISNLPGGGKGTSSIKFTMALVPIDKFTFFDAKDFYIPFNINRRLIVSITTDTYNIIQHNSKPISI